MKQMISFFMTILLLVSLTACKSTDGSEVQTVDPAGPPTESTEAATETVAESGTGSNILIAYFSVPENTDTSGVDAVAGASIVVREDEKLGNTEYVANLIQQAVGGDLFRIETAVPYPLEHEALVDQAAEEQDQEARPELVSHVENFEQYEIVLLGYPNWWGDLPMPVYSFLEEYDFGAKTIIPFITHGGSGASRTVETISQLQPGALIRDNALVLSRNDVADSAEEVTEWAKGLGLNAASEVPIEGEANTVLNAVPTPGVQQSLYLWEEDNVPAVTEYTINNGSYSDEPDFRPYLTYFPVPDGTDIKGAVLICAGGAFQFRSDEFEGTPVAEALSEMGYQSFVVDYRLRPYTQEEGALDLARAVRFVRSHAEEYDIDEKDIAVMGFSAGGILAGEMLRNFDGTVTPDVLDPTYVPDELDSVSANAAADGMIYSFYGRLSVGTTDVDSLREADLPPTFYCYGPRDPFYEQFLANAEAAEQAGVSVERLELEGMPHGFGAEGGWLEPYGQWLSSIFENN